MNFNKNEIDVVDVGGGDNALISENRINFVSEIRGGTLKDVLLEEADIIVKSQDFQEEETFVGPSIAFMTTLNCNLHCIYCYARGGDDKIYLDSKLAKVAIDNLARTREKHAQEILSIYFVGGGEPFLNFDCMKSVCQYAKNKFVDIEIILVSNGIFGKRRLEWLTKNNVITRISYDGVWHNKQRPFVSGKGSQRQVEKNIQKLAEAKIPLTVQLTVTNESVTEMAESVERIAQLGVKYVKIEPVHNSILSRGEKNLVPSIERYVTNFLLTIDLILNKELDIKVDNSIISRPTSGYYCGAGEGSNLTITPGGHITACLEISRKGEKYSDVMIYGQCESCGFQIEKQKRDFLNKLHFSNYKKCKGCNLKLICGGGCPMQGGWDHNDLFTPSEYNCRIHKLLLPKLFKMVFSNNKVLDIIFDNHIVEFGC